jgi:hypothetical protein
MEELLSIFKNIKEEFCSLWSFKERGATLEIITPYATTTDKFVSVFLTVRNKELIVSDGGWLSDNSYESSLDFDDDIYVKVFEYYRTFYDVQTVNANTLDYYFKKTEKQELVPNLVFDVANFIGAVLSSSQIQYTDIREKEENSRFNKQANSYLSGLVPKGDKTSLFFRKSINDNLKSIKFSAIVTRNNQLTLINYVTGSTPEYFIGSIGKANITFEVVKKSVVQEHIKNNVALINDKAPGFNKGKLHFYLEQLENTTSKNNIFWHERDKLQKLL